jgi:hypothetical protein
MALSRRIPEMFEMTFGDGKRRGMAFDSPSHAKGGVFVTRHGSHIVGKDWDKMKRSLTFDDNERTSSAERDVSGTQESLAKLRSGIKPLALRAGMHDGEYQRMLDDILGSQPADGAAATDRKRARDKGPLDGHGVPGDEDDDESELDEKIRQYLRGKGLADDDIEKAIELARKDREEARDSRPENAIHGGCGGRLSHATKDDVESEYGGGHLLDLPDYTPNPDRFGSGYDPLKGRDPARSLPGGGISRRLSNDAVIASDADLAKEYPGIENVGTSEWGR